MSKGKPSTRNGKKTKRQNKWLDPMFRVRMMRVMGHKQFYKVVDELVGRG